MADRACLEEIEAMVSQMRSHLGGEELSEFDRALAQCPDIRFRFLWAGGLMAGAVLVVEGASRVGSSSCDGGAEAMSALLAPIVAAGLAGGAVYALWSRHHLARTVAVAATTLLVLLYAFVIDAGSTIDKHYCTP
jgi:hypothetical protein